MGADLMARPRIVGDDLTVKGGISMPRRYWEAVDTYAAANNLKGGRSELIRRLVERSGLVNPPEGQGPLPALHQAPVDDVNLVGSHAWRKFHSATATGRKLINDYDRAQAQEPF